MSTTMYFSYTTKCSSLQEVPAAKVEEFLSCTKDIKTKNFPTTVPFLH